jgi:hypothetical protein
MIKEDETGRARGTRVTVLVGNPEGRRPLGEPRNRRENNIGITSQI